MTSEMNLDGDRCHETSHSIDNDLINPTDREQERQTTVLQEATSVPTMEYPVGSENDVNAVNVNEEDKMITENGNNVPHNLRHEVPIFIPKVEVHEVVREVPKMQVEWLEQRVEVPQVQYIDKYEKIPKIQYVHRQVPKIEVVKVPREVIKKVPVKETRTLEQIVEVPTEEKIYVPHTQPIATEFVIPKYKDKNLAVVVSQSITPEIIETNDEIEVEMQRYVPEIVYVDVFVPKPINLPVRDIGIIKQSEKQVEISAEELQKLTIKLNPHLHQIDEYNQKQMVTFNTLVEESHKISEEYGFSPPSPQTMAPVQTSELDTYTDNLYERQEIRQSRDYLKMQYRESLIPDNGNYERYNYSLSFKQNFTTETKIKSYSETSVTEEKSSVCIKTVSEE